MKKNLKSTYIKFLIFMLSMRRNFIPILSIYFLSIDNTTANQIGLFSGIGFLLGFLFEIPSGYLSDNFGHKKTLILGKLSMILSTSAFLLGGIFFTDLAFVFFTIGSVFLSIGFSFFSGTNSAFFHDYLESIKKEDKFTELHSKLRGQVSLVSIFFIIGLPFFTAISIYMPILIYLVVDLVGLLAILSIKDTKNQDKIDKNNKKSFFKLFSEAKKLGFLPISSFLGAAGGLFMGASAFRTIYLEDLGLPIIFVGFVMGLSRFVWFGIGQYIHLLEKHLGIRKMLFLDIFIFSGFFLASAALSNPYIVGFIMALVIGYKWGRSSLIDKHIIDTYVPDKRYKATMLSMTKQIEGVYSIVVSFGIGFVMMYSYKLGYLILGILCFFLMSISYWFIVKNYKKKV